MKFTIQAVEGASLKRVPTPPRLQSIEISRHRIRALLLRLV